MPTTLMTAKSALVAAIAALSIAAVPATPALALGDKEKGFVVGVATALIAEELIKRSRQVSVAPQTPQVVYVESPTLSSSNAANVSSTSYASSIYRTPAARAFNSYSTSERLAIQRNLRAWGYYRGGIDGVFGPGTYSAISAYASDEGASSKLDSTTGAFAVYDGLIF